MRAGGALGRLTLTLTVLVMAVAMVFTVALAVDGQSAGESAALAPACLLYTSDAADEN